MSIARTAGVWLPRELGDLPIACWLSPGFMRVALEAVPVRGPDRKLGKGCMQGHCEVVRAAGAYVIRGTSARPRVR